MNIFFKCFIIIIALNSWCFNRLQAQDPQLAHGLGTVMHNNPALTGAFMRPSFYSTYRNQWPGIDGTYVSYYAGAETHLDAIHGGLGVRYMIDVAGEGTLTTQNLDLGYAYRASLNENTDLRLGFSVGYLRRKLDWDKLNFGPIDDPRYGFVYQSSTPEGFSKVQNYRLNAGLALLNERYLLSYAMNNFNQPDQGFIGKSRLPIRHHAQAVFLAKLGDNNGLVFDVIYQLQQDFTQLQLKANYYNRFMRIGTGLRNKDAVIGMIGGQLRQFRLSYIYEMTISRLTDATAGSHEVQFTWSLQSANGKERECPAVLWNGF